jgi:hypothetical protein
MYDKCYQSDIEVVKEGRILNKIKQLINQIGGAFCLVPVWCQDLIKNGVFFVEKMSWKRPSPIKASSFEI